LQGLPETAFLDHAALARYDCIVDVDGDASEGFVSLDEISSVVGNMPASSKRGVWSDFDQLLSEGLGGDVFNDE